MSDNKNVDICPEKDPTDKPNVHLAVNASEVSSIVGSIKNIKHSTSSERQIKFERAQKCLENAALVSKRIKEHRKATAELLGKPFDDDVTDTASEMASTMSERTGYSVATDTSTTLSVQDALNIPGISESLANTLKQKELIMERIKQYKEISKRPMKKSSVIKRESFDINTQDVQKGVDSHDLTKLMNAVKEKENILSVMQVKMKALETTILDLQEKINEKDQIIESKNKATTLLSDSFSKKEKDTLNLLEDTRQQMTKMQSNFITMESEWKEEKQRLLQQFEEQEEKIKSLEEANTILENSRFEITIAHSKLAEEIEFKNKEILNFQEQIETLIQKNTEEASMEVMNKDKNLPEEKGTIEVTNMMELTKKLELLEQINCEIRRTNKDLECQIASMNLEQKPVPAQGKRASSSPHPTRKGGRSAALKTKSPWSNLSTDSIQQETEKSKSDITKHEVIIQSLNKDILDKEYVISQKDELIYKLQLENKENKNIINQLQMEVETSKPNIDKVHIGVCTESLNIQVPSDSNIISEVNITDSLCKSHSIIEPLDTNALQEKLVSAENQIALLNEEIEMANKNMVKVKSNFKVKLKQMQKTIDNFSKVSDANAEIIKLNEELHQLSQKVAELEEEKGNLQLHLVDYDSGRLTETDVYKKLVEMESMADSRLKSITLLETQKFDLVQELHELQQKNNEMEDKLADLAQLQSDHVCSEIKSVQLEEQIDELVASKKEMELIIENLKLDKDQSIKAVKTLEEEKVDIMNKLETCIQENMELTDKLEKLNAEKVSSAESIEMVESLTTQEKLELEEYNKSTGTKHEDIQSHTLKLDEPECDENISEFVQQSRELNKKVELLTVERQEVMDKMKKVCAENEELQERIKELQLQCTSLSKNIDSLSDEKNSLQSLTEELNKQIELLKREKIEVMKESIEIPKPSIIEEGIEAGNVETPHDEKIDKGSNRSKSVKQLTKDILKLKTTIKEREAEIADCQMKILSLEEQQEKLQEFAQNNTILDKKVKHLSEENSQLRRELENAHKYSESDQQYKQAHDLLQQEIQKIHQEYSIAINARDSRIHELENLLVEYEKQMFNYGNSLQQKDKEMAEYINQITKLNDVSQKLKSTIEILEAEKAKDQNADLVNSLNMEIMIYQKKYAECEEQLRILEEEKVQLLSVKNSLEVKNSELELEIKCLQETLQEKQTAIKEIQLQKQKQDEELSTITLEAKDRDEEIHEIKLQLRKESIENEKLRTEVSGKVNKLEEFEKQYNELKESFDSISCEKNNLSEQYAFLENKNKELLDKLKKLAVNIKKKSSLYNELEGQYNDTQKQLENKNLQIEGLLQENEVIPKLEDNIRELEKDLVHHKNEKLLLEQRLHNIAHLEAEYQTLDKKYIAACEEISKLNVSMDKTSKELIRAQEDNNKLTNQVEALNNKLVEYEIEQKNSSNLLTKINCLDSDLSNKQQHIKELSSKLEEYEQKLHQLQFAHDAKLQERDLYIENLQTDIDKYKNRICRLEESISVMEDRRHSMERKADQLDTQLLEKQKAYTEYTNQEDELVNRLAILIDHDRVVDKQLQEIEKENRELQNKVQKANEEIHCLKNSYSDLQKEYKFLQVKAIKADEAEAELGAYQNKVHDLEVNLKRVTSEQQALLLQKKADIEELEAEFNTQIESAIKEKKILSEKYERISEHVNQLEQKLQEYKDAYENLTVNLEDLSAENKKLLDKCQNKNSDDFKDYTEQYIAEINKLNALVNKQNDHITDLENKNSFMQGRDTAIISDLESKVAELSALLSQSDSKIDLISNECESIKQRNEHSQRLLLQKDEQIKYLTEKNKVVFEMNIPKTEGMTISSTIEQLNDQSNFDLAALQSQILPETEIVPEVKHLPKKLTENTLVQSSQARGIQSGKEVEEPVIVAKKHYDCYKKDENECEEDPFSSQEGWGFEGEDIAEVSPLYSQLNEQILLLKKENEQLKGELDTNNVKLLKVVKKLKELKASNDMLSNELKITKQLSEKSILDTAIENELSSNLENLEKKLRELNSDLEKEKREKEALRKQNEIFKSANDRLTEMKEKMDNELELWKFNFKQANDKISTLHWSSESKESPVNKLSPLKQEEIVNEELIKLEKENDELQSVVDEQNILNKKLIEQRDELAYKINQLEEGIREKPVTCENCENLQCQLLEIENCNISLKNDITRLNNNLNVSEENCRQHETKILELVSKVSMLEQELKTIKIIREDADKTINSLTAELESTRSKLLIKEETLKANDPSEVLAMTDRISFMEEQFTQVSSDLKEAKEKTQQLQNDNLELIQKNQEYEKIIEGLNSKIKHLNIENDQLLSTVAELRSSISSAVDQRGYEIAELWKQHLTQRETEFQTIEHDLRTQISASESKYETLLDNVQSSSQDETNKLIAMEQINSLQSKLQEKEEHLSSLQSKYAEVMHQLEMLRSEIEDEKLIYENRILVQQEEYEKSIKEITEQNQARSTELENTFKNLQTELSATKTVNDNLNQQLDELRMIYETRVQELTKQIQVNESEIYQKTNEYTTVIAQRNEEFENVRKQLIDYEKKIEDLTYEKEAELAVIRLKMHDNKEQHDNIQKRLAEDNNNLTEALNEKIIECTNLNKQISDLNIVLQEYATKTAEMQAALENQELEIVSLKDELFKMQNEVRSSSSKIEKHVTFASDTKHNDKTENVFNKDLLEAVPRAELDIALYMLHQRDVRCEELTIELTQLLEERDTLQLRLSDSLRAYEELKSNCRLPANVSMDSSQDSVSELPTFSIEKEQHIVDTHRGHTSRSSSIGDFDGEKPKLQAKLSELRSVKHSRDVTLRHESEQRQLGMRLLQRDVANLPPEALEQLTQAHHTLSRDTQSTSTVLLNWLRGKSTPKVVHM